MGNPMQTITVEIELPRDLFIALDIPIAEVGQKTKEWVVLELFREGKISSGKAGELLGIRTPAQPFHKVMSS
jgi:hypothetical protein